MYGGAEGTSFYTCGWKEGGKHKKGVEKGENENKPILISSHLLSSRVV